MSQAIQSLIERGLKSRKKFMLPTFHDQGILVRAASKGAMGSAWMCNRCLRSGAASSALAKLCLSRFYLRHKGLHK